MLYFCLFCTENTVARVAETGNYIAVVVKAVVKSRAVNRYVGVSGGITENITTEIMQRGKILKEPPFPNFGNGGLKLRNYLFEL